MLMRNKRCINAALSTLRALSRTPPSRACFTPRICILVYRAELLELSLTCCWWSSEAKTRSQPGTEIYFIWGSARFWLCTSGALRGNLGPDEVRCQCFERFPIRWTIRRSSGHQMPPERFSWRYAFSEIPHRRICERICEVSGSRQSRVIAHAQQLASAVFLLFSWHWVEVL